MQQIHLQSKMLINIANQDPDKIAVETQHQKISYGDLYESISSLVEWIKNNNINSLVLNCDNNIDWIVVDLACQEAAVICVPVPLFYTENQIQKLINSVQPDLILSDRSLPYDISDISDIEEMSHGLTLISYRFKQKSNIEVPEFTSKITYTSGSTGEPKGVCLSTENQLQVAYSLIDVIGLTSTKHLCLLPLATLLENIAGVYSPLLAGGTVVLATDSERGFEGSKLVDHKRLLNCISDVKPDSLILVPELLQILIHAAKNGWPVPDSLKFVAVGGSVVSSELIKQARELKLPVYQGYGLSECSSVVSLSTPANDTIEAAGSILPHLSAKVIDDELVVYGNTFLGYLEQPDTWGKSEVYTGDIVELCNSLVTVTGRKKNIIINSFGRNISPEWVESKLLSSGILQQAVVIGDNKPFCIAIIVPASEKISLQLIEKMIDETNTSLPDYAQVKDFMVLDDPMQFENGLFTSNGRPRRTNIQNNYQQIINQKYLSAVTY